MNAVHNLFDTYASSIFCENMASLFAQLKRLPIFDFILHRFNKSKIKSLSNRCGNLRKSLTEFRLRSPGEGLLLVAVRNYNNQWIAFHCRGNLSLLGERWLNLLWRWAMNVTKDRTSHQTWNGLISTGARIVQESYWPPSNFSRYNIMF